MFYSLLIGEYYSKNLSEKITEISVIIHRLKSISVIALKTFNL